MPAWLLRLIGGLVMLVVLLDVYLTVLYARADSSILSKRLFRLTWLVFRQIARPFRGKRAVIHSFCGPTILVLLVGLWSFLLALGGALITWPALGNAVHQSSGATPHDFVTALYASGNSMAIVGASHYVPDSWPMKLFFLFASLVGWSMISLTLTYLLQIYNAVQRRNTTALEVDIATAQTGDAAELLAVLALGGRFEQGATAHVSALASKMATAKEAHHFYPVLIYFRFPEPFYAMSRVAVVALDTVTLIKSALDDGRYANLKESLAVEQLWTATMRMATMLAMTFLPGGMPQPFEPDADTLDRWGRRYRAGVERLRQAGIETMRDQELGAEIYQSLRARWDRYVVAFSRFFDQPMEEVDPAGANPESVDERQDLHMRLHAVA